MKVRITGNTSFRTSVNLGCNPNKLSADLLEKMALLDRHASAADGDLLKKILRKIGSDFSRQIGLSGKLDFVDAETFIEIDSDPEFAALPFEMLEKDGDSLALQHPVSRKLMTESLPAKSMRIGTKPRVLVIVTANPKPILVLDGETQRIVDVFKGSSCRVNTWSYSECLAEKPKEELLEWVAQSDFVHLVGHLELKNGESVFQLDGSSDISFSAVELSNLDRAPSFVWLSTCSGAVTHEIQSFAHAMFKRGTSVFVGSALPANNSDMATASATFYRRLIKDRLTAGKAMLECRKQLARLKSTQWATIILYGDPKWKIDF